MKKFLLLLAIVCLAVASPLFAQPDDLGQQIDEYLTRLSGLGYSGSVLVAVDGEVVLSEGYGLANAATGAPNTGDTIFGIGSITKVFTAVAILQLHEAGALNVDDPISRYFDDVPEDKAAITIRQLLNHMGGLETYHDTEGDFQQMTRDEAYAAIMAERLFAPPGTENNYSNSGYTLLAMIIENVSGQTYTDHIRAQILTPLDLTRTGFQGEPYDDMAYTDNTFDDYGVPSDWAYTWVLVGNGGMVASNADLHRFLTAVLDYELISQETTALWIDFAQAGGWLGTAGGGDSRDYNAGINFNVQLGVFIFNMSNTGAFLAEYVNLQLERLAEGETVPMPPAVEEPAEAEAGCYTGVYAVADGAFTVTDSDGGLMIAASGQGTLPWLAGVTEPDLLAWYARLTPLADALLADAADGDFSPLADALGVPGEVIAGLWANLEAGNGPFTGYAVLGTTISEFGAQEALTVARLTFAEGDLYAMLYWNEDDELVDVAIEETPAAALRQLVPTGGDAFLTFSLFAETNPGVRFVMDGADATGLELSVGGETVAAEAVEQDCG